MLGEAKYQRLIEQVKQMHKAGNPAIVAAWKHVSKNYADPAGSPRFMHEVIAKAGMDARVQGMAWWQKLLADVRAFLIRIGLKNVTSQADIEALLMASLKRAMRNAEEVVPVTAESVMAARLADQLKGINRKAADGLFKGEPEIESKRQKEIDGFVRYYAARRWKDEADAKDNLRRLIRESNERYPFSPTDPAIVDSFQFVKIGNRVRLKQAPQKRGYGPVWSAEVPTDYAELPMVDWQAHDNIHSGSPESALKEYGQEGDRAYEAWVPISDLPDAKGEDISNGVLDQDSYARDEFRKGDEFPPVTVRVGKNGKITIQDGNHRIAYWREHGYSHVPAYVLDARKQLASDVDANDAPMAARSAPTDSPAFRKWFGDSKVVDAEGRPLVVYHGTDADISMFDTGSIGTNFEASKGFYFASSAKDASEYANSSAEAYNGTGANVVPVYLSIKKPLRFEGSDWSLDDEIDTLVAKAKADGHDGIVASGKDGRTTYVAFSSTQIKSATGNRGTYDPNDGNIMASRGNSAVADVWDTLQSAKTPAQARQSFMGLLENPNQFGWWDKTIGTQLNKASKNRYFGRVFDALQRQQDDTAAFAIEAEAEAADVLARMNDRKEIMSSLKSTITGERSKDLAAVSKAIFANIEGKEGVQQKVFTDAELAKDFGLNERQIGMYRQSRDAIDRSLDRYAQSLTLRTAQKFVQTDDLRRSELDDSVEALNERLNLRLEALRAMAGEAEPAEILRSLTITPDGQTRQEYVKVEPENANTALDEEIAAIEAAQAKIGEIAEHANSLKDAGYSPAMRFGDYSVSAYSKTYDGRPRIEFFGMADNRIEANALRLRLKRDNPDWDVSVAPMDKESFKLFRGISPDTIELFARFMDVEQDAAFKEYVALATSSRSAMKRMLERGGVAGFSENLPRVLSAFITSNSRAAAQAVNGFDINDAFESIPQNQGDVRSEAAKLIDYMRNPTDDGAKIRGFMFAYFMGGSISSALVNLTQPVMMTAPYLSQFAGRKIGGIMARTSKMAATGNIPAGDLKTAFDRAEAEGVTDAHEYHQLMQEAEGGGKGFIIPIEVQRAGMKAWGAMFGAAEKFNRRITFLAAFETAKGMSQTAIRKTGATDAYDFAKRAVAETQGIYAKHNRPNWARGTVGALLFTFKQFSIAYIEFFNRLPMKQKLLAVAMLILAAGLEGLPFADDLEDLIDTIGQKMGFGTNSKKTLHKAAVSVLGEAGAQFALYGISGLSGLPMDVAGRLGMGNFLPGTKLLNPSVKDKGREVLEVAGAAGGMAKKMLDAADQGKVAEAMPKAFSDAAKAIEMFRTGEYRDSRGRKVQNVDTMDGLMKLVGFQPRDVAEATRNMTKEMRDIDIVKRVEAEIADQWAEGIRNKDAEETNAARTRLRQWNEDNPDMPIKITMSQVIRRVKQANMTRDQRFAKTAPPEMRRRILQEATQ